MGINGASIATSISYIVFTLMTLGFYIRYTQARVADILLLKRSDIELITSYIKRKIFKK
jgi:Na+-driven multidrug efflux pump